MNTPLSLIRRLRCEESRPANCASYRKRVCCNSKKSQIRQQPAYRSRPAQLKRKPAEKCSPGEVDRLQLIDGQLHGNAAVRLLQPRRKTTMRQKRRGAQPPAQVPPEGSEPVTIDRQLRREADKLLRR